MLRKPSRSQGDYEFFAINHKGLFAELTSEEASLIKGGSVIEFTQIALLESQAKELCLYVNGKEVWSSPIAGKEILIIDEGVNYFNHAFAELYEDCGDGTKGKLVGYFDVPAAAVASDTRYLKGNKSEYLINYRVFS